MIKTFLRRKSRLAVLVIGAAVVLSLLWTAVSAQPQQPPFLLYGEGDIGDVVAVYDVDGQELGAVTITSDGTWYLNVQCDSENVQSISFMLNGDSVRAEIDQTGADQANVLLMPMSNGTSVSDASSDGASAGSIAETAGTTDGGELVNEDDDLVSDDLVGDESSGDELAGNDVASDESSQTPLGTDEEDDAQSAGSGYPESGSGGLVDGGPSTEALIGTIALLALVGGIAGLGAVKMRRTRNRA